MTEGDCKLDLELNPEEIPEVVTEPAVTSELTPPLGPVDYPIGPVDYPVDVDYQDPEGEGCSIKCEGVKYEPICGDDGVTYDNSCHMQKASCRSDRGVQILHLGECRQCDGQLEWMCGSNQVQ